ncbi:Autocrine proliferation repressor protein A [Lamellibrachia satsuma]|nr:Autocrine proliferation repressor protein A [Lamellibrachia satsuma]
MWRLLVLLCCSESLRLCSATVSILTLEDYVKRPDPTYTYREVKRTWGYFHNTYYLNMTSQKWMDETFSDRPVWWHDMVISVPRRIIDPSVAFLYIGKGPNEPYSIPDVTNDRTSAEFQRMSVLMGTVVCYIKQIPNQPIVFKADPTQKSREENSIIAYLMRIFIENESASPEMLLYYPMTKAVVRAMDTVTHFTCRVKPCIFITRFVVAGRSKRGWTTWTTTAVDKRVIAQMPMVMTALKFREYLQRHQRSLGGWSFVSYDYYVENNTRHLDHPRYGLIMELTDPYSFIKKYTVPTMVVASTGDQFFLLDASHIFFNELPGPKYIQMMPNHDHRFTPMRDFVSVMQAFTIRIVTGCRFPQVSWQLIETARGGKIAFKSSGVRPLYVISWFAYTASNRSRDFRANFGLKGQKSYIHWNRRSVRVQGCCVYIAEFYKPKSGWLAFFIE